MIKIYDFELRVQKPSTGEIFYPVVKSFSTADGIPFEHAPEATIKVVSSNTLTDLQTVSSVEFDDIVRLRGSVRSLKEEPIVFVDLFEGRVQNMNKELSGGNGVSLDCTGHINEVFDTLETFGYTWTDTDVKTVLQTLMSEGYRLNRVEFSNTNITAGILIPEFNVKAEQTYFSDVFQNAEIISGKNWFFDTKQIYNNIGVLLHSYLCWNPLPETATPKYAVVEGSYRLISATVSVIGEDVKTLRYVKGGTNTSGVQYHGDAFDADAMAKYGARFGSDSFSWVMSDSLCVEIAKGFVADSKNPYISIQVTLDGVLDARKGDLVAVNFDTLEIKGVKITGNYTVATVRQTLNDNGSFTTALDLGRTKLDEHEYLYKYVTRIARNAYKNQY